MTVSKAARLVSEGSYSIYNDNNDYDLLRKVLKVAFPKDELTEKFDFSISDDDEYYGCDRISGREWANVGEYLKMLHQINLSDIKEVLLPVLEENKINSDELEFDALVEETLQQIRETLIVKGKEYRRNNNPYHNFEVGARKKNITREKALDGMLLKHEISIEDITNDLDRGVLPTEAMVNEKFGDNLVFLIIKKAMFIDRILKSNESNH